MRDGEHVEKSYTGKVVVLVMWIMYLFGAVAGSVVGVIIGLVIMGK